MKQDLWKYSIYELIKGYKKKKFNPVEVVESIINKISNDNNRLNAYVYFNEDSVLKQAKNSNVKPSNNKAIARISQSHHGTNGTGSPIRAVGHCSISPASLQLE